MTAAALPTLLSAQGMIGVGVDVLGLAVPIAVALATFLELALIASGLLSRVSALEGRPGGADVIATWVVSFVSGCFSAAHELIAPVDGGTTGPLDFSASRWQDDPASLLAAAVRLAAPLVAAWLWHRVLTRDRRTAEDRSLAEIRRNRRLLALACSARKVRRLDEQNAGTGKLTRARRRMDRRHAKVLRLVSIADPSITADIAWALGSLADSDTFPALTRWNPGELTASSTGGAPPATTGDEPNPNERESAVSGRTELGGRGAAVSPGTEGSRPGAAEDDDGPDDDPDDRGPGRGTRAQAKARLGEAVQILQANPAVTGPQMAQLMASRGHPMTDRTGLRWVERAQVEVERARRPLSVVGS